MFNESCDKPLDFFLRVIRSCRIVDWLAICHKSEPWGAIPLLLSESVLSYQSYIVHDKEHAASFTCIWLINMLTDPIHASVSYPRHTNTFVYHHNRYMYKHCLNLDSVRQTISSSLQYHRLFGILILRLHIIKHCHGKAVICECVIINSWLKHPDQWKLWKNLRLYSLTD